MFRIEEVIVAVNDAGHNGDSGGDGDSGCDGD
jgi:hypothetical protein